MRQCVGACASKKALIFFRKHTFLYVVLLALLLNAAPLQLVAETQRLGVRQVSQVGWSVVGELRPDFTTRVFPSLVWQLPRLQLSLSADVPTATPDRTSTFIGLTQSLTHVLDLFVNASISVVGAVVGGGLQALAGRVAWRLSATYVFSNTQALVSVGARYQRVSLDLSADVSRTYSARLNLSLAI